MNLAGGGAFSPSLSAPVLAPPIEEYGGARLGSVASGAMAARGNKAIIFAAIGGFAFIVVGRHRCRSLMTGKDKAGRKRVGRGRDFDVGGDRSDGPTSTDPAGGTAHRHRRHRGADGDGHRHRRADGQAGDGRSWPQPADTVPGNKPPATPSRQDPPKDAPPKAAPACAASAAAAVQHGRRRARPIECVGAQALT